MLHDKEIREPLFEFLEEQFGRIRILEEKMMGRSRADVIMVTEDALIGIEIKSDADSYTRLSRQVSDYDRYFDRNYAVVGTSHAAHIEEHVPEYWGIITVEEERKAPSETGETAPTEVGETTSTAGQEAAPDFYILRRASDNPHLDANRKIGILWRPELAHIQERYQLPKYKSMSKRFVAEKLVEKLPEQILAKEISRELFERDYTTISEEIAKFRRENASGKKKGKKLRASRTRTNVRRLRKRSK